MSLWHRFQQWLFKPYQLMVLEPEGGQTVRHMRVNLAAVLSIVLILSLGSALLAWYYAPQRSAAISARYYQLQQQNHDQRDQLATFEGELAVANEQIDGLKHELLGSQQQSEKLRQSQNIYESILEARKSSGVQILRATARMQDDNPVKGERKLSYAIVLVKGGNYPRSVSGSVRITAIGVDGQKQVLRLDQKTAELPYRMDTHAFLEGSVLWQQDWQPSKLNITRLNYQGAERDQMDVDLEEKKSQ